MFNSYILLILLLNLIISIFSYELNLERSVINADYFVFCIIVIFIYDYLHGRVKVINCIFLLFIICIDIISLLVQIFPFLYLEDFFYLLFFFTTGPDSYRIWSLAIVVFTITTIFIFFNLEYKKIDKRNTILLLILFICIGKSQAFILVNDQYSKFKEVKSNQKLESSKNDEYISKDIVEDVSSNSKRILLIVNESWGSTSNESIQRSILNPLYKNKDSYDYILNGSFKFVGSTVSGELRELCQKYSNVMNITKVEDKEFTDCLPSKLRKRGYNTYAIHGTDGKLYDRKRWYPLAGFENVLFKDSFKNFRDCKSFSGKCDYDLFEPISNILANGEKVFLYWLTLNTHSPYDDELFIDGFDCSQYDIKPDSETCLNLKQQYQFFYRLSEYTKDDRMKGVEIYIVGDHAPPIMSLKEDYSKFKDSKVGWLKFKIKDKL